MLPVLMWPPERIRKSLEDGPDGQFKLISPMESDSTIFGNISRSMLEVSADILLAQSGKFEHNIGRRASFAVLNFRMDSMVLLMKSGTRIG
jgi:hypothetical protein